MFFHWFGVKAVNTSNLLFAIQAGGPGKNAWEALPVGPPAVARIGTELCFSGVTTGRTKCQTVIARRTFRESGFQEKMYVVPFDAGHGDSGSPVWNPRTGAAVGLISARAPNDHRLTFVAPLLKMPHESAVKAPGALSAPGMYSLNLITGD
jgi:hypothetical protein